MEKIREVLFNLNAAEPNNELNCVICNKCLSVPPIMHNNSLGNVCGRKTCTDFLKTKGKNYQQFAYESVAKFLEFPCMYRDNGCQAELKWGEVSQHEDSCFYKNSPCPFSKNEILVPDEEKCKWIGGHEEFLTHMEEAHTKNMFFNRLELNLWRNYTPYTGEIYFTRIQGDIVILFLYINDQKTVFCKVWAGITIYQNLRYQIKIYDENYINSTTLRKQNVELFFINVLKRSNDKNWLKIDLVNIENFLENPVTMVVEFEYYGFNISVSKETKILCKDSHEGLININLRETKCDLCGKELFPPVYMCCLAHNICVVCKKSDTCPKCSSKLSTSRNIAYEKLKYLVAQPCRNFPRGCSYFGPYPELENHERSCHFKPRKCILGCTQEIDNFLQHLMVDHPLSISDLDVIYTLNRLKLHIFLFDDEIFLFTKKLIVDEGFTFGVVCLGMKRVKYRYELHLINDKYVTSEIMLSNIIRPELIDLEKYKTECLKGLTNVMCVPYLILEHMFPDLRSTKFKMSITKIDAARNESEK